MLKKKNFIPVCMAASFVVVRSLGLHRIRVQGKCCFKLGQSIFNLKNPMRKKKELLRPHLNYMVLLKRKTEEWREWKERLKIIIIPVPWRRAQGPNWRKIQQFEYQLLGSVMKSMKSENIESFCVNVGELNCEGECMALLYFSNLILWSIGIAALQPQPLPSFISSFL